MKLFRTSRPSIDVVQECRSYFRIELSSCLIRKNKTSFCHGITVWRICVVDIVVSCDFLVLLYSEMIVLLSNFICLPLLMVNKVNLNYAANWRTCPGQFYVSS